VKNWFQAFAFKCNLCRYIVRCFNVARPSFHVTVFFLSLPTDPVADPLSPAGGSDSAKKSKKKTAVGGGGVGGLFNVHHKREEDTIDDALRVVGAVQVEFSCDP
jgi:hypothetical protein